jgi:hypothetical protein
VNGRRLALLVCLASALAGCSGGDGGGAAHAAAASPVPSRPVEITLRPKHGSGVTGKATLAPAGENLIVTLRLDKRFRFGLAAHIHTGPCSDEPTFANPRIWASLDEVRAGRSRTTVNTVTLRELQAETSSINVHDPSHGNRAMVCGDIPLSSEPRAGLHDLLIATR